jgi:TIR domain
MAAPSVFISHRHADKAIAQVIAEFLHQRSSGDARIFCSSSIDFTGPIPGDNVEESLKQALAASDVVLLIFTSETEDWSYCMWECGVATDPAGEKPTTVVVLQCGPNSPRPYAGHLSVDARNLDSITSFVTTFLTGTRYFPGRDEPLTNFHKDGREVKEFARELYNKLNNVLSTRGSDQVEERSAATYLCVELDASAVDEILTAHDKDDRQTVVDVVRDRTQVVYERGARALFQFQIDDATTIGKLVDEWAEEHSGSPRWFESLVDQMGTVVRGRYPVVKWAPYQVEPSKAIIPFVAGCRTVPSTGHLQVHLYFVPMSPRPVPVAERMIIPEQMFHKNLADTPGESILLTDLLVEMRADNRSRVPMLGEGGRPRFMVHKSMIEELLSARAIEGADVRTLTVHDLLVDSERADVFRETFALVDRAADLDQALAAMKELPGCQDVFVTTDGSAEGAVVGWLTNSMFI